MVVSCAYVILNVILNVIVRGVRVVCILNVAVVYIYWFAEPSLEVVARACAAAAVVVALLDVCLVVVALV